MTNDNDAGPALEPIASEFFTRVCQPEVVTRAETTGLDSQLWDDTQQLGFPLVGLDESRGGSGGSLADLLVLLQVAGRHAAPLPLAETNLAAWLLADSGQSVPQGPMTVVPGSSRDTLSLRGGYISGIAYDVPWARDVGRVVALLEDEHSVPQVVAIDPAAVTIRRGSDLAGMPRDAIIAGGLRVESSPCTASKDGLFLRGALLRSAQLAGALEQTLEMTRQYVSQRVQFDRPVASFQSVQQHVVTLAQVAAMSSLAVAGAARAAKYGNASFEICSTKLVVNQNAALAARAAHQAHGAIGMTREYRLQQFTRRLHAWRGEFGDEQGLARRVGAGVARHRGFAQLVTAPSGSVGV